jgi:integrase
MSSRRRRPAARLGADGFWHAWVTVGTKTNGRPDQRHVKRKTQREAEDAADDLLDQVRRDGAAPRSGRKPSVQEWFETYLDTVAPRRCNPGTVYDYRSKLRNWVYPTCGAKRLDRLSPEDLDAIYLRMIQSGKAPSHQLKVHRILSRGLEVALRRGLVVRNVAKLIDAPSVEPVSVQAVAGDVARRILAVAGKRRNPERWAVGFALGLRQGEAIGLRWDDDDGTPLVDLDAQILRVWYQLRRRIWRHGCSGSCGRKRGAECPQRHGGGLVYVKTKGKSRRTIPIPEPLVPGLRAHRKRQAADRLATGMWPAGSAVWTTADGRLTDPRDDYDEWVSILREAGVSHVKPHIMRHTAATMLLLQGVDVRVVQRIMGHRDIRTTAGYTEGVDVLMTEAVERVSGALLAGRSKVKGVRKGVLHAAE